MGCGLSAAEARHALRQLLQGHSSYWPTANLVLLSSNAGTHLAEEAAHFLRQSLAPLEGSASVEAIFYLHTVEEALAFFGSKLIFPSRRPCSWRALFAAGSKSPSARAIASCALAHLAQAGGQPARGSLFPADINVRDAVCHMLGYRLGEALFSAVRAGACDHKKVRALFRQPTSGEGRAFKLYWQLTFALRHYLRPVRTPARQAAPAELRCSA